MPVSRAYVIRRGRSGYRGRRDGAGHPFQPANTRCILRSLRLIPPMGRLLSCAGRRYQGPTEWKGLFQTSFSMLPLALLPVTPGQP